LQKNLTLAPNQARDRMKKQIFSQKAPNLCWPLKSGSASYWVPFVSGQLAIDPKQGKIVVTDIVSQTQQVMTNIKAILEAANYSLNDVIQTTVYLSKMALFKEFNIEYSKHFSYDYPARANIGCDLKNGALVEITAVVYKRVE
jgi:2-iminobutanoate/2-iminopropanoate deaminase